MPGSPLKAAVQAGKLIGHEIYQNGGALVESVRYDTPISNYMNTIVLERLVMFGSNVALDFLYKYPLELFCYAQLGTGTSPNPRVAQDLEAPILNAVYYGNAALSTGTAVGGFNMQDINYSSVFCRQVPETDPETGDAYNGVRVRWRLSHRHVMVPATQTTPIVVSEIGWSNSASGAVSSRIVLPPDKRITLTAEQFLVTIYEVELILPDMRSRPFSNLQITGAFQWANLSAYQLNQVVTDGGVTYKSLIADNTGNVPANSPAAWEAVTTPVPQLSGVYAFRAVYPMHSAPVVHYNVSMIQAVQAITGNNYFHYSAPQGENNSTYCSNLAALSTHNTLLSEGYGVLFSPDGHGNPPTGLGCSATAVFDYSEAADGKLTATARFPRDTGVSINNVRSIFIFGHQFLLDVPICRASDQELSITASIQWSLVQEAVSP